MPLVKRVIVSVCLLMAPLVSAQNDTRTPVKSSNCSSLHSYECVVDNIWQRTITWLNAWAEHDVDTYLLAYAPEISPIEGKSYAAWKKQREKRVGNNKTLKLGVHFLDAEIVSDRKVRVLFIQRYRTDTYNDIVLKTLVYQHIDDEFRIIEEISHQELSEQDAQTILDNIN